MAHAAEGRDARYVTAALSPRPLATYLALDALRVTIRRRHFNVAPAEYGPLRAKTQPRAIVVCSIMRPGR